MAAADTGSDSVRSLAERKAQLEKAYAEGSVAGAQHASQNAVPSKKTPTTLATAAAAGDLDAIQKHIDAKIDVDGEVDFGGTALLHAASKGQNKAVVALLKAGADPTRQTKGGRNALHLAAEKNLKETVEAILSAGGAAASACLEAKDKDGRTPLMLAAQGDAAAAAGALIEAGADLEAKDSDEDTALLLASRLGKAAAAEALAKAGADYYEQDDGSSRVLDAARQGIAPEAVREAIYDMLLDVFLDRE